ncbi:cellulase family glycosylhydrolase [Ruminococcus sp.]|uniref:cellulase family glycosylhydrolase n=2 Tax=Ruminococcus sp. TaxID=41978 RepID=UPI0025F932B7|nr:cellulase family glycosylhydrolase [Ruminococcus sp.]
MRIRKIALIVAAALAVSAVGCAKEKGTPDVVEKDKETQEEITTVITEEETTEMATEHISPVETVSATLNSQITVNRTIGRAEGSNTIKFPLADLIEDGDRVKSFTFTIYSGDGGDIGGFKGGCGIAVDTDCPAATNKGWYQSPDFSAPTQGSYGEITWNVPDELKDYIHAGGEVLFGYWWGNCESIRIENVVCTYERTREVPVDGMGAAEVGISVNYSDADNTIHVPLDFIPDKVIPQVVTFKVSAAGGFGKYTGAFGINSSKGKYQSGDTAVFTNDSSIELVWFVPDKAKECIAQNNELVLGYWWSEQPSVTLDTVSVKYSQGEGFTGEFPVMTTTAASEDNAAVQTATVAAAERGFRTADEIVSQIKVGWNLGNTLDSYNTDKEGLETETAWGNVKTTKEIIKSVKSAGFNAIRIPVTWAEHMNGDTISTEWMNRVQEVVDYAYNEGMFVIINMHHDDYIWFEPQKSSYNGDSFRLKTIWEQICERFADYDDRLIFEGMNEPRTVGSTMEWMGGTKDERTVINDYANDFVNTVRKSGGNNAARTLIVTTYAASADSIALNDFRVPTGGNIILSVHYYAPWKFAEGSETAFTESGKDEVSAKFAELKKKFIDKGTPVIIDEFGCVNAASTATRCDYYKYYINNAKANGIKCFVWDNGKMSGESSFGIFNRGALTWDGDLLGAIMEGAK